MTLYQSVLPGTSAACLQDARVLMGHIPAKPSAGGHMLTDTERKLLVRAREIVKRAECIGICTALSMASEDVEVKESRVALAALHRSIDCALDWTRLLPIWIREKTGIRLAYTPRNLEKLRNTRLAWIDYMLANW